MPWLLVLLCHPQQRKNIFLHFFMNFLHLDPWSFFYSQIVCLAHAYQIVLLIVLQLFENLI